MWVLGGQTACHSLANTLCVPRPCPGVDSCAPRLLGLLGVLRVCKRQIALDVVSTKEDCHCI